MSLRAPLEGILGLEGNEVDDEDDDDDDGDEDDDEDGDDYLERVTASSCPSAGSRVESSHGQRSTDT